MFATTTTTTTTTTTSTTTTGTQTYNSRAISPRQAPPAISRHTRHTKSDLHYSAKEIIKSLRVGITNLRETQSPNFNEVLCVCKLLKENEHVIMQAQQDSDLRDELNQLRSQLPRLFRLIHCCLDRQADSNILLDTGVLQTICMSLSTLAPPLTGSLLTDAQRRQAQPVLSSISIMLANQLSDQLRHGDSYADANVLINCLNWFSRALKADLLQKNASALNRLFREALDQIRVWSDTDNNNLGMRQLAKCMVQLDTMVRQNLINIDPLTPTGQINRQSWAKTVENLCQNFLTHDGWLGQCHIVELINVTNTLKDGLEQGLLKHDSTTLARAIDRIAVRLCQQGSTASSMNPTLLANCANFLRCLFELDLLGGPQSPTGQAVNYVIDLMVKSQWLDDIQPNSAQSLVNLTSFLKAADRWMAGQSAQESYVHLAQATTTVMQALTVLLVRPDQNWMHVPQLSSSLLSALQHLWQRGLVQPQLREQYQSALMQLLQKIANWPHADHISQSILQSLRACNALVKGASPVAGLVENPVFGQALTALLTRLQQNGPGHYKPEERLVCLEAAQIGASTGAIAITSFQPLLQGLVNTHETVDLIKLEEAIGNAGEPVKPVEALSEQALSPSGSGTIMNAVNQTKPRGETYRGTAQSKINEPLTLSRNTQITGDDEWIVPRNVTKPVSSPVKPVYSSNLPFASVSSTMPVLVNRSDEHAESSRQPRVQSSARIQQKSSKTVPQQTKTASKTQTTVTLQQAQKEWFQLLTTTDKKVLPRLQELASLYPQLPGQKAEGKKGQIAFFYALTEGKKEIVEWLLQVTDDQAKHQYIELLLAALDSIEELKPRHVAATRILVDWLVKRHDSDIREVYAKMPGMPPSKKEIQDRRALMISDIYKARLAQFTILKPLLEEYKLLTPIYHPQLEVNAAHSKDGGVPKPQSHIGNNSNFSSIGKEWKHKVSHYSRSIDKGDKEKFNAFKTSLRNIAGEFSLTEEDLALKLNNLEDINLFLNNNLPGKMNFFMGASYLRDIEKIKLFINLIPDIDAALQIKDDSGSNALMHAALNGNAHIVAALLDAANNKEDLVRAQNNQGLTALHMAAEHDRAGHAETVTALFNATSNKIEFARITAQGMTALMHASVKGNTNTATAILRSVNEKDELAQMQDKDGMTALMMAIKVRHRKTVIALLDEINEKDALLTMHNAEGKTALNLAFDTLNVQYASTILKNTSDINHLIQKSEKYITPMQHFIIQNYASIENLLGDIDPESDDSIGVTQ